LGVRHSSGAEAKINAGEKWLGFDSIARFRKVFLSLFPSFRILSSFGLPLRVYTQILGGNRSKILTSYARSQLFFHISIHNVYAAG
jgi:hypothetical protein